MIGLICEAFNCSPDIAERQDFDLCEQIMLMRNYSELREAEKRDAKMLSPQHRKFIIDMERWAGLVGKG